MTRLRAATAATVRRLGIALLLLSSPWFDSASAQTPGNRGDAASCATLGAAASALRAEIALIGEEMGRPYAPTLPVEIENARVHDVQALARTLLFRANRLMFERARVFAEELPPDRGPADGGRVQALLDAAGERLAAVKQSLDIAEPALADSAMSSSWDDVAATLLGANRHLDVLINEHVSSREVYGQLTEAIGFAARLLTSVTGSSGLPDAPAFERRRRPSDVCVRLLTCLDTVRRIDRSSVVRVNVPLDVLDRATAAVAFDLAALVTASVASLYDRTEGVAPPLPGYHPGPRLPSHVYRRAGILEMQLAQIERMRAAYLERLSSAGEIEKG